MSLVLTDIIPADPAAPADAQGSAYAVLTLNNPGERNTLTAPLVAEIVAAMDTIEEPTPPAPTTRRRDP